MKEAVALLALSIVVAALIVGCGGVQASVHDMTTYSAYVERVQELENLQVVARYENVTPITFTRMAVIALEPAKNFNPTDTDSCKTLIVIQDATNEDQSEPLVLGYGGNGAVAHITPFTVPEGHGARIAILPGRGCAHQAGQLNITATAE